jgi:hypothetical protein
MSLTTLFTLLRKRSKKIEKSNCPYKLEPSCGVLLEKRWGLYVKPSVGGLKHVENESGSRMKMTYRKLWLPMMLMLWLISLNACAGKVILLKEGEMSVLDNGNYSVSPAWMEERLLFENDMVKRLQECNSN